MTKELTVLPNKPNIIYFNSSHINTPECTGKIAESFDVTWTCPSTWGELSDALQIPNAMLAIKIDMMTQAPVNSAIEFMDALATITKFMPCHDNLKIGVVIKSTTPRSVIKDLQKTQCQGILLYIHDYPIAEVNKAFAALVAGIPYWPKHILDNLPGSVKKIPNADSITLTAREGQVLNLIVERGASNKVIAKSLGISESTVKLHMSKIFKKYGVRSRTQLAVFNTKDHA